MVPRVSLTASLTDRSFLAATERSRPGTSAMSALKSTPVEIVLARPRSKNGGTFPKFQASCKMQLAWLHRDITSTVDKYRRTATNRP